MLNATADEYADLLERVYGDVDSLQQVLGVPYEDVRTEALARGAIAVRAAEAVRNQ
ncbi:hypothetical protein Kisp02_24410 [Kineosporia sp. NBRC 101731]|nr:hypothetical protein Kisp02_24410 [Kineosporia sp. NBRC 101731]